MSMAQERTVCGIQILSDHPATPLSTDCCLLFLVKFPTGLIRQTDNDLSQHAVLYRNTAMRRLTF